MSIGLMATVGFLVLPLAPLTRGLVFVAVNAAAFGAMAVGIAVNRPSRLRPWAVLLAGEALYLLGFVVWYPYPLAAGRELPYPSVADALFLPSYCLFGVAMVMLVHARSPGRNRADLIDASIMALGLGVLSWVFLIDPIAETSDLSTLAKTVSAAYPLVDILLFALAVRLAVAPGRRGPAFWLMAVWIGVQLGTDVAFAKTALDGTFRLGGTLTAGWLASMVVLGAAALHPSMAALTLPGERRRSAAVGRRLPLLAIAALVPPILLVVRSVQDRPVDVGLVASVSSLMFLLVLKRVSDLMVDVAEYERVQEQLRRLASIVESSDDAISSWTIDGTLTSWNAGATRLFGYAAEEVLGHLFSMLIPPGGEADTEAMLDRIKSGEPVPGFETTRLCKDGSLIEVSLSAAPIRDGAGAVVGGAVIARDITALRRADRALRTSTQRSRSIVDTARDAFVGMDRAGLITDWNRSAEKIFGWARREAVGRSVADTIVPPRYREAHAGGLRHFFESGEGPVLDNRIEISALHRDGHEFPIELLVWATSTGDEQYFSAFVQDITERQQIAEALAVARDQAMEASRLKSEFLATMSHEIRTPMNGVIGLTGLLLNTSLDASQRQFAEGVRAAGEALLAVINNILDFSKIEAGKMEIEILDFPVSRPVEDAVGILAHNAQSKGLELIGFCRPELPAVLRGDEGRIRQVLLNLASNAVKFTDNGEVVVRAELANHVGGAEAEEISETVAIRFEVADTGIGVDPERGMRLFQPFSQADASTTRRYGGTGLGLAISKQLVEAMGGAIGVDSEPGNGSTFWFTVPLQRAVGPLTAEVTQTHSLEGVRVLVVDDNATNRLVLGSHLASWGMLADAVEDGASALGRLQEASGSEAPYEIALLDLHMEGMDGLELARAIAADPALSSIQVLLLTSGTDVGIETATGAGIRGRLTKPVRPAELHAALVDASAPVKPSSLTAAAAGVAPVPATRGTVLVAEDNDLNQIVARGILSSLGFSCDVVANGLEAVEAVRQKPYTAVLMDFHMPEMDGVDATIEIRRHEGDNRRTPIIAMTAGARIEDRDRCLGAGMDDYISKPVAPKDLETALAPWVAQETPAPTVAADPEAAKTSGVVDPERLTALLALEAQEVGFVAKLLNSFFERLPAQLEDLDAAVSAGDGLKLEELAHRLKGVAGNIGATAVAGVCGDLEALGRARDLGTAAALVAQLHVEADRAREAFQMLLAGAETQESRPTRSEAAL